MLTALDYLSQLTLTYELPASIKEKYHKAINRLLVNLFSFSDDDYDGFLKSLSEIVYDYAYGEIDEILISDFIDDINGTISAMD